VNIRQAILKAADHIERNPRSFDFHRLTVPGGCGTPGCALGWIGYFGGVKSDCDGLQASNIDVSRFIGLNGETGVFYKRLGDVLKSSGRTDWYSWSQRADYCAEALRIYADLYHPEGNFARDLAAKLQQMPRIADEAVSL
jgi:hypothetical protein